MGKVSYRKMCGPDGLLANERPFEGNSLTAECDPKYIMRGRLPYDCMLDADNVRYVVYSYSTPIGWVLNDGTAVVPDLRYSVTTSKQQTYLRAWMGRNRRTALIA